MSLSAPVAAVLSAAGGIVTHNVVKSTHLPFVSSLNAPTNSKIVCIGPTQNGAASKEWETLLMSPITGTVRGDVLEPWIELFGMGILVLISIISSHSAYIKPEKSRA